jgi:hypothetical protein
MNEIAIDTQRRFRWGFLLVCASWIPVWIVVLRVFNSFRGITENKATGLGAVAGGYVENLGIFGAMVGVAFAVIGITLLIRSCSREHWLRSLFSVVVICLTTLPILLTALSFWELRRAIYR